jgi:hypothetical protein
MQINLAIRRFSLPMDRGRRSRSAAPHLRTAQLSSGKIFAGVECFPPERWRELDAFRPRILVGSSGELQSFAAHVERCGIDFASVDRAIFVTTRYPEPPMTDVLRVVLWQTFGVPIYEVYLAPDSTPLCYECEAHDGLHPYDGTKISMLNGQLVMQARRRTLQTGLVADLLTTPCACGRPGARIVNMRERIERRRRDHHHRLAATA